MNGNDTTIVNNSIKRTNRVDTRRMEKPNGGIIIKRKRDGLNQGNQFKPSRKQSRTNSSTESKLKIDPSQASARVHCSSLIMM
jgi:hypothetical protein